MKNLNFEKIVKGLKDGVVVANRSGDIIYLNDMGKEILGISELGINQKKWPDAYGLYKDENCELLHSEDLPLVKAIKGTVVQDKIMYLKNKHLKEGIYIRVTANPIKEDGKIVAAIAIFSDCTNDVVLQKQIKDQNEELERVNKLKNEFIGMAAHDIKNPLSIISGFANLIEEGFVSKKVDIIKTASEIRFATERLLTLIENVLELNKMDSKELKLDLKEVDFSSLINNLVGFYRFQAVKNNVSLDVKGPSHLIVKIDQNKVSQVITNFISNALKYTPEQQHTWVNVKASTNKGLHVEVVNEGAEIPEADYPLVFESFKQTTLPRIHGDKGSGLGLSICKRIIENMDGNIGFESKEGKTHFYFYIPNVVVDFSTKFAEDSTKKNEFESKVS